MQHSPSARSFRPKNAMGWTPRVKPLNFLIPRPQNDRRGSENQGLSCSFEHPFGVPCYSLDPPGRSGARIFRPPAGAQPGRPTPVARRIFPLAPVRGSGLIGVSSRRAQVRGAI